MSHPATSCQDKSIPAIGHIFTELATVDSSNNYAMARAHDEIAIHGSAFFAHEQTAGKGQRGKKWVSQPSQNITMSIVLQPEKIALGEQFLLSAAMALGCYDLLNFYCPADIFIKWPNDLYIGDKKTGGILIQNIVSADKWKYAVVGIGLNINQSDFSDELSNPTSLKLATGQDFDPIRLAKELCARAESRYQSLVEGCSESILTAYNSHLYRLNQKSKLKKGNQVFETNVKEVNRQGQLITEDIEQRSFEFGEVEWVKG